ncbi:hypothetical protein F3N42_05945 [Marinihelvus fidelis]|uniref:Uncharacterized protein n=1 Tax=Marinihelvus fidelis TaxID=2613842 RepID=A0A5N0TCD5_9GAMM|nr:hypothetical protein [Marinihelvus fidelis]KAA9132753.1 hypothetical protein F3N42_05945 [Marinihelvus fidelis]
MNPRAGIVVRLLALLIGLGGGLPAARANLIETWIASFADSEIEFQRGTTDVPFLPLAYIDAQHYDDTELRFESGETRSVSQSTLSQALMAPFLVTPRDAVLVGEWVSHARFEPEASPAFDVTSVAVPVGWLRQVNTDWQVAAFVMPLGHHSDLPAGGWTLETMGGVFTRKVESERFWWTAGAFFDVGEGDDLYLPYFGASWTLNQHWTVSAILPWPALLWSPNRDTLFRLGASPSGTSWRLSDNGRDVSMDLSTFDVGLSVGKRLFGNIWGKLEGGVGGYRGLSLSGGDWEGIETPSEQSAYLRVGIEFRPSF